MFVLIWVTLLFAVRSSNAGTDVKKPEISRETTIKQGKTLTCSADRSPLRNDTGLHTFVIPHATADFSGQYICKATHQNDTLMNEVNVTVTYTKKPGITGKRNSKEDDNLNLRCNAESYRPSPIIRSQVPDIKNLHNGTETDLQNNTVSATLVIHDVTAELTGQYICTAQQLNTNVTALYQKILNSSGCRTKSGVLTCMCISQGFPLPTIKWELNHIVRAIITTVSNHTINSTITLNVKDQSNNTSVVCVSTTDIGEVKKNLNIDKEEEEDYLEMILRIVKQPGTVIAFLIGIFLSSITCCLMRKCQRKKTRTKENLAETGGLEMVTSDADQLIYNGYVVEGNQAIDQEEAGAAGTQDVEYSNLDFSLIKDRQDATGVTPGTTETEYAEIKKAMTGQDEEGIEEDEEIGHCAPVVEEGEDVALYSTVKDIMDDSYHEDSVG